VVDLKAEIFEVQAFKTEGKFNSLFDKFVEQREFTVGLKDIETFHKSIFICGFADVGENEVKEGILRAGV